MQHAGYGAVPVSGAEEALACLKAEHFDLVLMTRAREHQVGLDTDIREIYPTLPIVTISAFAQHSQDDLYPTRSAAPTPVEVLKAIEELLRD